MRVVFLTHNYPRHAGDLAGAFLHPLAVAIRERGHDVRVVAPSDAGRGGREVMDGVPVLRVRYAGPAREHYAYTGRMQDAVRSPGGWWALARLMAAFRRVARDELAGAAQGVVHAHWWFPAGLAAPPERPCVVTLHGTDARLLERGPVTRRLARWALRRKRVVTAVSRSVATLVQESAGRVIDAAHVSPMPVVGRPERSTGGGGVVFVGRLTDQKRLSLAIGALAEPGGRDLSLTVVGDGPARSGLERLARDRGVADRVRFLGQVAPGAVRDALRRADAFVFPAQAEGFGLAAIEALLAGVPVVACRDGGGVLDVLSVEGAGRTVEATPGAIAAMLGLLVGDADARARAAHAGEVWADRLAPARVAERCEAWYHEAARV